jgi:hypothetical protein
LGSVILENNLFNSTDTGANLLLKPTINNAVEFFCMIASIDASSVAFKQSGFSTKTCLFAFNAFSTYAA